MPALPAELSRQNDALDRQICPGNTNPYVAINRRGTPAAEITPHTFPPLASESGQIVTNVAMFTHPRPCHILDDAAHRGAGT
jgi:hypothetical protein